MDLTIRPASPAERLYAAEQNIRICKRCGNPGCFCVELDETGRIFLFQWIDGFREYNTPEFAAELTAVQELLHYDERYGHVLENRAAMLSYCLNYPESCIQETQEYVFRADAKDYAHMIRCIPAGEDRNYYNIYSFRRDMLDRHMKQAEQGVRFLTPAGKEKFRIPDGDRIQITTSGAGTRVNTVRFVDAQHFLIVTRYGSYFYHIQEFPEWLDRHNGTVIPLRSTLPEKSFSVTASADKIVIITKGEAGQRLAGVCAEGVSAREGAAIANETMGVTKAQEAAMLYGSIYGWDKPAADPAYYNEQGEPMKRRHRDLEKDR